MPNRSFQAICIKPTSPAHFGEKGVGVEAVTPTPHSDTIFSALCLSYLQLYGRQELESFLSTFIRGQPPFLLSSAFPFYGEDPKIFFFPKPKMPAKAHWDIHLIKKLKECSFLSKSTFEQCLKSGIDSVLEGLREKTFRLVGKLMVSANEEAILKAAQPRLRTLYKNLTTPRNRLNRLNMSSQLYYMGATRYHSNSGIYFLMEPKMEHPEAVDRIICCLNLLGDEGLGGKRSLGYGRFDYTVEEGFDISEAEDADAFLTLSLYHPTKEEVEEFVKRSYCWSYRLLTRAGYAQSPLLEGAKRKRPLAMMVEGSVFPRIEGKSFYGDVPSVEESGAVAHSVYRYGYAFPLAVRV